MYIYKLEVDRRSPNLTISSVIFVYKTWEEELWEYILYKCIYSFKRLDKEYINTK